MDENHQNKTTIKQMATEDRSQLSPFSLEDEKEAQEELDLLRKRLREHEKGVFKATRNWTGFRNKTLWDWLDLIAKLAIPIVVLVATIGFGWWQVHLADLQHQSDQQNVLDQQRQATLVKYLDNMNDLLLNRGLLTSKSSDAIRVIARTETLAAMRQLDGKRNSLLVQFLQDANLIGFANGNIVNFSRADLSSTDLSGVYLSSADLTFAKLNHAILFNAFLSYTDLSGADLTFAKLNHAILFNADLVYADLSYANLSSADLRKADLGKADLSGADLSYANLNYFYLPVGHSQGPPDHFDAITQQQLDQVYSCKGAILPQGLTCHQNR